MFSSLTSSIVLYIAWALATPIIWDGRASLNLTAADLDSSTGPFLTYVFILCLTQCAHNGQCCQGIRGCYTCEYSTGGRGGITLTPDTYHSTLNSLETPSRPLPSGMYPSKLFRSQSTTARSSSQGEATLNTASAARTSSRLLTGNTTSSSRRWRRAQQSSTSLFSRTHLGL